MKLLTVFIMYIILSIAAIKQAHKINTFANHHSAVIQKGYKVFKIDSVNNIYIIYLSRHDTLFKVISLKQKSENCITVRVNSVYNFKLHSRYEKKFLNKYDMRPLNPMGSNYYGNIIQAEDYYGAKDIFTAENLKGLCFKN